MQAQLNASKVNVDDRIRRALKEEVDRERSTVARRERRAEGGPSKGNARFAGIRPLFLVRFTMSAPPLSHGALPISLLRYVEYLFLLRGSADGVHSSSLLPSTKGVHNFGWRIA